MLRGLMSEVSQVRRELASDLGFPVVDPSTASLGVRVYQRADFDEAVRLIDDGTIPADRLITDVVPLSDAVSAIERLSSGSDVVKILIDCR